MTDKPAQDADALPGFGALPGPAEIGLVRRQWEAPTQSAGGGREWCCQCVDATPIDAWDGAGAPYILLEPEWRVWRGLPRAAAQRQWLRGRVAAKDAVRLLLWDRYRLAAPLETIGILADGRGQPCVTCAALRDGGVGLLVSISHCGNRSVALASERSDTCRGVGIDVASRADNHDGLAEGGFVPAETALLDGGNPADSDDWLLRLWCAKEAVGKALGVGLMGNPLNFIVRHVNRANGAVEVTSPLVPAANAVGRTARTVTRVGRDRDMVFAVARLEEAP